MVKRKKSSFWTLVFSLMPGAAEMYMGFMKRGVSLMALFVGIAAVSTLLELGPVMFLAIIIWFYGFFHARNLASMNDMELQQVEDEYLFINNDIDAIAIGRNYKKVIAVILILLGIILLWNSLMSALYELLPIAAYESLMAFGNIIPKLAVGVLVIFVGAKMIAGKKQELYDDDAATTDASPKSQSASFSETTNAPLENAADTSEADISEANTSETDQ